MVPRSKAPGQRRGSLRLPGGVGDAASMRHGVGSLTGLALLKKRVRSMQIVQDPQDAVTLIEPGDQRRSAGSMIIV